MSPPVDGSPVTAAQDEGSRSEPRTLRRLVTLAAAALAGLLVWALTRALDVALVTPAREGHPSQDIPVLAVLATSVVAGLAGWALLAVLERTTRRPRSLWLSIAGAVLLVSLAGPLLGQGLGTSTKLALVLMHVCVGLVILVGLGGSTRNGRKA